MAPVAAGHEAGDRRGDPLGGMGGRRGKLEQLANRLLVGCLGADLRGVGLQPFLCVHSSPPPLSTTLVAEAFQTARTSRPGARPSSSTDCGVTSAASGCPASRPRRTRLPSLRDRDDPRRHAVPGRACSARARRLDQDLPRMDAEGDGARLAGIRRPHRRAALELDRRAGVAGLPARPETTTDPTRSATNAEPGRRGELRRVPALDDPPIRDHADLLRERGRLLEVVGDQESRDTGAPRSSPSARGPRGRGSRRPGRSAARRGGGPRARRQGSRQGDALALPAGERPGLCVGARREPEAAEQLDSPAVPFGPRPAQRVRHVLPRAEMWEERVVLEEVAAAALLWRHERRRRPSPTRSRQRRRSVPSPVARGRQPSGAGRSCRHPRARPAQGSRRRDVKRDARARSRRGAV